MTRTSLNARFPRRPIASVIAVGVLFLALGVLDIARGLAPLIERRGTLHLASDDLLVLAIGIVALVAGFYVLRGRNWARWVLAGWMVVHVVISAGELPALGAHLAIFGLLTFVLFRPGASSSFSPALRE